MGRKASRDHHPTISTHQSCARPTSAQLEMQNDWREFPCLAFHGQLQFKLIQILLMPHFTLWTTFQQPCLVWRHYLLSSSGMANVRPGGLMCPMKLFNAIKLRFSSVFFPCFKSHFSEQLKTVKLHVMLSPHLMIHCFLTTTLHPSAAAPAPW